MDQQINQIVRTGDKILCTICLTEVPVEKMCKLSPCLHEVICLYCLTKLEPLVCPICRRVFSKVMTHPSFQIAMFCGESVPVAQIKFMKRKIDDYALDAIPNVWFTGDQFSGKVQLIKTLIDSYGLSHSEQFREDVFHISDFRPNVTTSNGGILMRFVDFPIPWFHDQKISPDDMENLRSNNIHLIVICVIIADNADDDEIFDKFREVENILLKLERYYLGPNFKAICIIGHEGSRNLDGSNESFGVNGPQKLSAVISQNQYTQQKIRKILLFQSSIYESENLSVIYHAIENMCTPY